jgi:anti-sigma B factor antagonist
MGESKLRIEEREVGDVTVLTLGGEITLDDGDLVFGRYVDQVLARKRVKILVDLAGVTYIDSSGIGMMVAELRLARKHGGDMRLLRLTSKGQRLFSLLKLRSTFEAFEDEAMAVRSFELRPTAG